MTPDEIDTAIAEFRGWTNIHSVAESKRLYGFRPKSEDWKYRLEAVPQFHKCLNAMHDAENSLNQEQAEDYLQSLSELDFISGGGGWVNACAPASERAEAFLRAVGRWQEPEKLSTHCAV